MNAAEFYKIPGPGKDILTGPPSMQYPNQTLDPLSDWQKAVAFRFAEAYAASQTARADRAERALREIKTKVFEAMNSEGYGHDTGDLYQRMYEAVEAALSPVPEPAVKRTRG